MIVRKIPKEKRIKRKLFNCFTLPAGRQVVSLLETLFLIIKKIMKLIQKNPQRTKSIQRGDIWQLPFSKRKGPSFPIFVRKSGAQLTPMPETNGEKWAENGREKTANEIKRAAIFMTVAEENPNIKKKIIIVNKI